MKFGNLEKLVIEGSRPWIKFPKDDSLQTAPKFAEEKFPREIAVPTGQLVGGSQSSGAKANMIILNYLWPSKSPLQGVS